MTTTRKTIKVPLDVAETAKLAARAAEHDKKRMEIEKDRRDLNAELKDLRGGIAKMMEEIRSGQREIEVPVRLEKDVDGAVMRTWRTDVDPEELVEERTLESWELQRELELDAAAKGTPAPEPSPVVSVRGAMCPGCGHLHTGDEAGWKAGDEYDCPGCKRAVRVVMLETTEEGATLVSTLLVRRDLGEEPAASDDGEASGSSTSDEETKPETAEEDEPDPKASKVRKRRKAKPKANANGDAAEAGA